MTYRTARHHLDDHLMRIRVMLQRHLRRHADRLVGRAEAYADVAVGRAEMRRALLLGDDRGGQKWLDLLGVPTLFEIEANLEAMNQRIEQRLTSTQTEGELRLPLEDLRADFGLDDVEFDILITSAAPRLDAELSRLFAVAWADFSVKQPTANFIAELVDSSGKDVTTVLDRLGEHDTLRQNRLVVLNRNERWEPHTPLIHAPVAVPLRVIDFIAGRPLDARDIGCFLHRGDQKTEEGLLFADDVRGFIGKVARRPRPRLSLISPSGSGRRSVLVALARQMGRAVLEVEFAHLVGDARKVDPIVPRLAEVLREARLQQAILLCRMGGLRETTVQDQLSQLAPLVRLLADHPDLICFTAAEQDPLVTALTGPIPELTLRELPEEQQKTIWRRTLMQHDVPEQRASRIADDIGRRYRLTAGRIVRAVRGAVYRSETGSAKRLTSADLEQSVRQQITHKLGRLADPVMVSLTKDDVVLPESCMEQIDEILRHARFADQVYNQWGFKKHGALGLSVLFSGPPGTGKTLMSSVLARELGRPIYRVDLSRIVDKYIGETEKNLARIFDEAEHAQAVLLFDEADSLFAKRTNVKSSNDRYANLEVNFLLQRLESYTGVAILTTNFATSIDEAFQRRIRFKVEFPKPDVESRIELWRRHLPPETLDDDLVDFRPIAEEYDFTGGHIRNAALRAAFHAAEAGSSITEDMLFDAAISESREMGLLVADDY